MPGIMIPAPDPNSTREVDISDACQWEHQHYVASAYGNRPEAVEAADRVWTGQEMRDRLASRGYPSDSDARETRCSNSSAKTLPTMTRGRVPDPV